MTKILQKETIVFAPATFNLAETTRMIEIAKRLHPKFRCIFFGFSETYSHLVLKEGFEFSLLNPVFSADQEKQIIKLDQMKGLKNPFNNKIVQERVKNELNYLNARQPKIIVTGTNLTIFLSARVKNIPLVYVKPYAYSRMHMESSQNYPPQFLQKKYIPTGLIWFLVRKLILNISYTPMAFRKTAAKYNLKLPRKTIDLLDGDDNLITTFPEFSEVDKFPNNYHSVGPIFAELDTKVPSDIQNICLSAKEKNNKIILFAMGSSGNRKLVLKILKIIDTLGYVVIAPVKHYLNLKEDLPKFSENIFLTEFIPAHLMAPFIDFSIIHGGEGTVQTACLSGKPFIGFGLQYEQETNIKNCQLFGNAIGLNPKKVSLSSLSDAIALIQTSSYTNKAKKMKESMSYDGAALAAKFIETNYFKQEESC